MDAGQPSNEHTPAPARQRSRFRRWLRRAGWITAVVMLAILVRYTAARLSSGNNAVRVAVHLDLQAERTSQPVTAPDGESDGTVYTLRVAAWNIAHGRGTAAGNHDGGTARERIERLREMGEFLRDANLDVVVLNEVDFDAAWSNGVNQADALAQLGGFGWHVEQRNFDVVIPGYTLRFGNAVLSRYPVVEARLVRLPAYRSIEGIFAGSKHALVCTIKLPDGDQVRVLAVHLSHRSEAVRIASVRLIRDLAESSELPLIAAGDFNSAPPGFPLSEPIDSGETALDLLLQDGLFRTTPMENPSPVELTWPATRPDRVLDWITVSGPLEVISKSVYPLELSDHRPVVATVRLTSEQPRPEDAPPAAD
jgi:endonuclease/exonuclease/phosphatase family metal-dependent hydrolase